MVDPERLELPTPAFEAQCSIQLSYGSKVAEDKRTRCERLSDTLRASCGPRNESQREV